MSLLKYIVLDVDGTLTDGGVYYTDDPMNPGKVLESKKFCTKDGTGIIAARAAGIEIIVLTGRECAATTKRLTELGVAELHQGVRDKVNWLKSWIERNDISRDTVGYIGDDVNDLQPMKLCGFIGCPNDAAIEVKEIADYISPISGGHGAVRDVIEHYLREQESWTRIVEKLYGSGT